MDKAFFIKATEKLPLLCALRAESAVRSLGLIYFLGSFYIIKNIAL
jgi:hypothetical protein